MIHKELLNNNKKSEPKSYSYSRQTTGKYTKETLLTKTKCKIRPQLR